MTTMYKRRLLSIDRRAGLQLSDQVAAGRAQRELTRSNEIDRTPIETMQALIDASLLVGFLALATAGLFAFALHVLGG